MSRVAVIAAPSNMAELGRLLAEGWYPISVTAQYCATAMPSPLVHAPYRDVYGGWLVILEKPE